jgi:hypothetical protein
MKKILCLFLLAALTACGSLGGSSYTLNASSITVTRGSSVRVGVVAPGLQAAPEVSAQAANAAGGLTVAVVKASPNPADVRAIVSVSAEFSAPLGQQSVLVTFPSGSATLNVNVTALGNLKPVRGVGRTTTVASGTRATVWIKNDGSVWERRGTTSSAVPGISNAVAVGLIDCCGNLETVSIAATTDGTIWTWDSKLTPQRVAQIPGGVVDLVVVQFPTMALLGFALGTDGRVWRLNLQAGNLAATVEPDIADVAAVRAFGRSFFVSGGQGLLLNQLSVSYLKMDGTAQTVTTNEYFGGPQDQRPPNDRKVSSAGQDLIDLSSGFGQLADGRAYYGKYRIHDTPVKHLESDYRVVATNGSNTTAVLSAFCLFADGSLWQTALINDQSLGQAGNPLSSSSTTQVPLTLPNNADVLDFSVVGNGLVVWTAGGLYFAATPFVTNPTLYDFQPIDLPDVRRPSQ